MSDLYSEVRAERERQHDTWGQQNHPDGTALDGDAAICEVTRELCDTSTKTGRLTWRNILEEEVAEVFAESDPQLIRAELLQVAGVAVAWMEAIDRRACHGGERCPAPAHHEGCFEDWIAGGAEGAQQAHG